MDSKKYKAPVALEIGTLIVAGGGTAVTSTLRNATRGSSRMAYRICRSSEVRFGVCGEIEERPQPHVWP